MPTNPNMVAIQTVTVGSGGAASIDFTSIPQTYTDLIFKGSVMNSQGIANTITVAFNNSTANFSGRWLEGNGSSVVSGTTTNWIASSNDVTSTPSNWEVYIPNYTSSNNKSYSTDSVVEANATLAYATLIAGLWSNTSAINRVTFTQTGSNFRQNSQVTLYGVTSAGTAAKATGGIITMDDNYFYHTFLASGTFTPTSNITADYLVVAGGGGSGGGTSGGGGAGGARSTVTSTGRGGSLESPLSLTASTNYTVTIGAGGTAGTTDGSSGGNGSNSVFSTITSTGGGGGKHGSTGLSGGSGGGAGYGPNVEAGGAGTTGQGYDGGSCTANGNPYYTGAGGGGAGAAGASVVTSYTGGAGGNGIWTALTNAVSIGQLSGGNYYVGGGGAGGNGSGTVSGGLGGGGSSTDNTNGVAGTVNTGGGAGGPGTDGTKSGATGGSGIVIVRYAK
jgi:hypothetical protein